MLILFIKIIKLSITTYILDSALRLGSTGCIKKPILGGKECLRLIIGIGPEL